MKSKKEIQKCIEKLKLLHTGIPHYSKFGDNNWRCIDVQVEILEQVLKLDLDETSLQNMLDEILDKYDGNFPDENTDDKHKTDALDWVIGKYTDEDLVSDDDIRIFCKGKKK